MIDDSTQPSPAEVRPTHSAPDLERQVSLPEEDDSEVGDDEPAPAARPGARNATGRPAQYGETSGDQVRRARRRADFGRCMAKILDQLPPGTLLTEKGATFFAEIAADACGAPSAGVFRLVHGSGEVHRIDSGQIRLLSPVSAPLLERARKRSDVFSTTRLLVARIWPWDPDDVARSAFFVVVSAPADSPDMTGFNFTQVDRRRITTLTTLIGLREAANEQKRAEQLLRKGTRVMAATSRVEKRLADLAAMMSEAAGAEHMAIWLASQGNNNIFRLRAIAGGPALADRKDDLSASPAMQRDMLRLAQARPVAVATSAVDWLPRIFDVAPEQLGDSALVIPVRRAGDLIGVATGIPSAENADGLADIGRETIVSLLEALADQVALATEFARSARDAQLNARRFALLASIAEIALAKMGAAEMVDAILARVREHFDAHKASLFLLHGDRGSLGTRSVQRQDQTASRLHTARIAVAWEDQLIGSLVLRRADQPFEDGEEETLVQVADQIALALSASGRFEFQAAMAILDMLTDLPNRRSAETTLDSELGRTACDADSSLIVCLLDIDLFKAINDQYGHECGDVVLKQIAAMFRAQLRGTDYLARWGGEEFLLLFRTNDLARARQVAERVRRAAGMISPKTPQGKKIVVSMSLGGAVCPLNGTTRDQVIAAADTALYYAKAAGRDQSAWAPIEGASIEVAHLELG